MRLNDYLGRVRVSEPLTADVESLRRLHVAHREAFLFENISIQTGGGISVALEDIERKFLDEGEIETLDASAVFRLKDHKDRVVRFRKLNDRWYLSDSNKP